MQALGYSEGRNFHLHERHADGDAARLSPLAAELLAQRVDVIVAVGTDATHAAREVTSSVPVIMAGVGDPVRAGFVFSLPYPGGNITGTALLNPETVGKQLEMLKEAAPALRKVAILRRRSGSHDRMVESLGSTAAALGVTLFEVTVATADDLPRGFDEMSRSGADGFLALANPALDDLRNEIAELSLRYRLPGAGWQSYHATAGYLLSYGPSLSEMHSRAANYVDKIARGRRPADLPVEQAERFKLAINTKTAKALGLTIPSTLLARADEVIE
jgi:putative tryptophan/tyrosine transport system substrate-binding protein